MEDHFQNYSQDEGDDDIEDIAYLLDFYVQGYEEDQDEEDQEDPDEDDDDEESEDEEDQDEEDEDDDDDDIEDAYLLDDEDHADFVDNYDDEDDSDFIDDVEMVLSPSVLHDGSSMSYLETVIGRCPENLVEENGDSQRRIEVNGEGVVGEILGEGELNRSEIEGMFCPICLEAWTNGGEHQICCLPCGHLYGFSCIKRWFQRHGSSEKCPLCNRKCSLNDVRVLYASKIVAVDQELQKKARSLEAKCVSLEKKDAEWCKKEFEWHMREYDLYLQIDQLTEELRAAKLELGESVAQQECNEMKKMMDKMEERLK